MRKKLYYFIVITAYFVLSQSYASNIKAMEQEISDSLITTKITAQFTKHKHLNPLKISVSTINGIVTLSGFVGDKTAFVDALRIAKNTGGVRLVVSDNLNVKKVNTSFTDAFITAKVETAVLKAKVLDDESIPIVGINATTTNGVVTLSGMVDSGQAMAFIIKRVNDIPGVKKIISHLTIKDKQ
jgi:hyperosmotically inducible protein